MVHTTVDIVGTVSLCVSCKDLLNPGTHSATLESPVGPDSGTEFNPFAYGTSLPTPLSSCTRQRLLQGHELRKGVAKKPSTSRKYIKALKTLNLYGIIQIFHIHKILAAVQYSLFLQPIFVTDSL